MPDRQPEVQEASLQLQAGITECCFNPFVPRTFQRPIESKALEASILAIGELSRLPLMEAMQEQQEQLRCQREQIQQLHRLVQKLEQAVRGLVPQRPGKAEATLHTEAAFQAEAFAQETWIYENSFQL